MNTFLSTVAAYARDTYGSGIEDMHFIFPNRRAVTVFKHHLVNLVTTPIWSPSMSSVDDWMKQLSDHEEAGKFCQQINLFQSYSEVMGQDENFDNFLRWGDMLLRDFDELDKYLVPVDKIFKTISDIKNIEVQFPSLNPEHLERLRAFWEGFHPTPSTYEQSWLRLWQSLEKIYGDFHGRLRRQGLSTSGMIYRSSLQRIENNPDKFLNSKKYLFIGFNALTAVEERVFEICKREGKAEFFWDVPEIIMEPYQESGRFIRENIKKFPPASGFVELERDLPDRFGEPGTANFHDINIYACESGAGQIALLHQLIDDKRDENQEKNSRKAVVLSDEALLEPVLSAISDKDRRINISMGYPVERSLISDILSRLVEIHFHLLPRGGGALFLPTVDLQKIVNHPLLPLLFGDEFVEKLNFLHDWPTSMIPLDLVLKKQENLHLLFSINGKEGLNSILVRILRKYAEVHDRSLALETESQKRIYSWLNGLNQELANYKLKLAYETFRSLFKEFIQKERLSFQGSLDAEIQLTGILETRLMDYDEILILSCNEGVWPADSSPPSLIPYSLRKAYDLPTREFSDSFYGYYFYRLLQRAKRVSLMYVNSPDPAGMSQGDPSRFIQQLKYDSEQFCNDFVAASSISPGLADKRTIKKTGEVFRSLAKFLDGPSQKMMSPSAINTYIDCPLKFALQYILRIREGDELIEAGEPRMFGLLLHKSLEIFYQDFEKSKKPVTKEYLEDVAKNKAKVETYVRKAFLKEYFKSDENAGWPQLFGRDLLVYEVISKHFVSVLLYDIKITPFTINALEGKVERMWPVSVKGDAGEIRLGGYIDRMDEKEGVIRILDYKTGNPDLKFVTVADLFDSGRSKRPKEILQAAIYSILLKEELGGGLQVRPVIYPSGKMRGSSFDPGIKYDKEVIQDISCVADEIKQELGKVFSEMFNPDIDFCQTDNNKNCEYCSFKQFCRR